MLCDLPPFEVRIPYPEEKATGSGFQPGKYIVSRETQSSYRPSRFNPGGAFQGITFRPAVVMQAASEATAWQKHVCDVTASTDVDVLTETSEAVLETIQAHGPAGFNLQGLPSAAVINGEHLATALRTSFTWRDQVPGWHGALRVAERALKQAGLDPEDVLFGMI